MGLVEERKAELESAMLALRKAQKSEREPMDIIKLEKKFYDAESALKSLKTEENQEDIEELLKSMRNQIGG